MKRKQSEKHIPKLQAILRFDTLAKAPRCLAESNSHTNHFPFLCLRTLTLGNLSFICLAFRVWFVSSYKFLEEILQVLCLTTLENSMYFPGKILFFACILYSAKK